MSDDLQTWQERAIVVSRQPTSNQEHLRHFLHAHRLDKITIHCIGGRTVCVEGEEGDHLGSERRGGWGKPRGETRKMKKSDIILPILRQLQDSQDKARIRGMQTDGCEQGNCGRSEAQGDLGGEDTDGGEGAGGRDSKLVVFFDDDIREVLDPDLREEACLERVLFVSSSWAQRAA